MFEESLLRIPDATKRIDQVALSIHGNGVLLSDHAVEDPVSG